MTSRSIAALSCLTLGVIGSGFVYSQAPPASAPPTLHSTLHKYCVTCHSKKLKTAGLMLDALDVSHVGDHPQEWEKVARKFRTGEMPPPGLPRPAPAVYAASAAELETALDAAAAAKPNPGRVAVHRLNRNEYTAAVRDLLGLDIDGHALLA